MKNNEVNVLMISKYDDHQKIFETHRSDRFIYSENKRIVLDKTNSLRTKEMQIEIKRIEVDEEMKELFETAGARSLKHAEEYSNEPIGTSVDGRTITDAALSSLMKYSYMENYSIFDICTDAFISILNGHCLSNGNKRSAFSFLKTLLGLFRFYLVLSESKWMHISGYEAEIKVFAAKLENETDIFDCEIRSEIKKWIIKNVIIISKEVVKNG